MPDHSESSPPSAEGDAPQINQGDTQPASPASASNTRSILGLALVSALNIGCVAFIAFHFTTHADEPAQKEQFELRPGNVSLEPATAYLLAIASHVEQTSPVDDTPIVEETVVALPTPPSMAPPLNAPAQRRDAMDTKKPIKEAVHWVQLGALSKIATARSYWAKLQKNHDGLLASHRPNFAGPDQVGGSLYHIRVGPLAADAAASLCSDLQQEGTECFCVAADGEETDHKPPQASTSGLEPS